MNATRPATQSAARGFRIPLIPANEGSDLSDVCIERPVSQITRREVILFVVKRIVGNMHLAVDAAERAKSRESKIAAVL